MKPLHLLRILRAFRHPDKQSKAHAVRSKERASFSSSSAKRMFSGLCWPYPSRPSHMTPELFGSYETPSLVHTFSWLNTFAIH